MVAQCIYFYEGPPAHLTGHSKLITQGGFCSWGMFQFAQPVHADKHFQVCSINLKTLHPIFHLAPVAQKVDITINWINGLLTG